MIITWNSDYTDKTRTRGLIAILILIALIDPSVLLIIFFWIMIAPLLLLSLSYCRSKQTLLLLYIVTPVVTLLIGDVYNLFFENRLWSPTRPFLVVVQFPCGNNANIWEALGLAILFLFRPLGQVVLWFLFLFEIAFHLPAYPMNAGWPWVETSG